MPLRLASNGAAAAQLRPRFPRVAELLDEAEDEVLA
jgi:hypothetical protein